MKLRMGNMEKLVNFPLVGILNNQDTPESVKTTGTIRTQEVCGKDNTHIKDNGEVNLESTTEVNTAISTERGQVMSPTSIPNLTPKLPPTGNLMANFKNLVAERLMPRHIVGLTVSRMASRMVSRMVSPIVRSPMVSPMARLMARLRAKLTAKLTRGTMRKGKVTTKVTM
jgi:hypothetical protein